MADPRKKWCACLCHSVLFIYCFSAGKGFASVWLSWSPYCIGPCQSGSSSLGDVINKVSHLPLLQGRKCDGSRPGALLIFLLKHCSEAAPSNLGVGFQGVFLQLLSQSLTSDRMVMNLPPCANRELHLLIQSPTLFSKTRDYHFNDESQTKQKVAVFCCGNHLFIVHTGWRFDKKKNLKNQLTLTSQISIRF